MDSLLEFWPEEVSWDFTVCQDGDGICFYLELEGT